MQNDLKYTIRSREIVDLMAAIRNNSLTLSPYFKRNLVWRDAHKRDFIDTILQGFPFPQIFLARGPIDLDSMTASQAVVDGQQRLSTIKDFITGHLEVGGKKFSDLADKEKEEFLKYEVAVIDFDLDVSDARLKDVFHRLNRTYYSLSAIEKLASEYSASEFMLVARVLAGEILKSPPPEDDFDDVVDEDGGAESLKANVFSRDPGIEDATWEWLQNQAEGAMPTLLKAAPIFTPFEFDRKVPLMFVLNVMCTYLTGYYERNNRVRKLLDEYSTIFEQKEDLIIDINESASYIADLNLPNDSAWFKKANLFTLVCELSRDPSLRAIDTLVTSQKLNDFAANMPGDYALAAREAVGRKPQRELRGEMLRQVLLG